MISRRSALKGLGVALGLPWLEAMSEAKPETMPSGSLAGAAEADPPSRLVLIYTPNGYNQETFVPLDTGEDWELPPSLAPLRGVRHNVTLVSGLDRQFVPGTGVHAQCGACWLTSSPPTETLDGGFPTNTTLDQLLARRLGRDTRLPSIELSCNDFTDNKETKYFESISWYGPGHAAQTEKNPRAVFQRLFGKPDQALVHRSILDAVLQDARRLNAHLGHADRQKLEEFLTSVRATERRIQLAESTAIDPATLPLVEPQGIPERRDEYLRLMSDLITLAFQMDVTRVVTLVVDPERWDSPRMYHGVFDSPQNHHVLTHTKGDEAKEKLSQIDRFHVEQFAYLVQQLANCPEGDGNLLDQSLVAMGSGISDGNSHNYGDLQVLLAGSAGGRLRPGRHLHYDGDRPLADLWLTVAHLFGDDRQRFADSTGVLTQLIG